MGCTPTTGVSVEVLPIRPHRLQLLPSALCQSAPFETSLKLQHFVKPFRHFLWSHLDDLSSSVEGEVGGNGKRGSVHVYLKGGGSFTVVFASLTATCKAFIHTIRERGRCRLGMCEILTLHVWLHIFVTGWLGIKQQFTYLLIFLCAYVCRPACGWCFFSNSLLVLLFLYSSRWHLFETTLCKCCALPWRKQTLGPTLQFFSSMLWIKLLLR